MEGMPEMCPNRVSDGCCRDELHQWHNDSKENVGIAHHHDGKGLVKRNSKVAWDHLRLGEDYTEPLYQRALTRLGTYQIYGNYRRTRNLT